MTYAEIKRNYRKNNPLRASYQNWKDNAKRRGKPFKISFEYFCKFAIETDYINKKGRTSKSYHIDRIDETKGYVEGNLQVLSNRKNVQKYFKFLERRSKTEADFTCITVNESVIPEGCPY